MLFKSHQALVIGVGPAHIQFGKAFIDGIFDGSPKQKRHAPEAIELRGRATVFVGDHPAMIERQNARDGLVVF